MEERYDNKLPGSALFIHLCCAGCGARSRADGDTGDRISATKRVNPATWGKTPGGRKFS